MKTAAIFTVMVLGVAACGIWLGGLIFALDEQKGSAVPVPAPRTEAVEVAAPAGQSGAKGAADRAKDGQFRLLALGDSLTRGAGDVTGGGYVGYTAQALEAGATARKEPFVLNNLGIDGFKAPDLIAMLEQANVQQELAAADVILLSIGGNDLHLSGKTLINENQEEVDQIQEAFETDFQTIHTKIRAANPDAPLMMIGLYNPFGQLKSASWSNGVLRTWNARVGEMLGADPKAVLVPTADLFQLETPLYLHGDQFHPNAAGYQRMAERVVAALPKRLTVAAGRDRTDNRSEVESDSSQDAQETSGREDADASGEEAVR